MKTTISAILIPVVFSNGITGTMIAANGNYKLDIDVPEGTEYDYSDWGLMHLNTESLVRDQETHQTIRELLRLYSVGRLRIDSPFIRTKKIYIGRKTRKIWDMFWVEKDIITGRKKVCVRIFDPVYIKKPERLKTPPLGGTW